MSILFFILSDVRYAGERTYNGLRPAGSLPARADKAPMFEGKVSA